MEAGGKVKHPLEHRSERGSFRALGWNGPEDTWHKEYYVCLDCPTDDCVQKGHFVAHWRDDIYLCDSPECPARAASYDKYGSLRCQRRVRQPDPKWLACPKHVLVAWGFDGNQMVNCCKLCNMITYDFPAFVAQVAERAAKGTL